MSAPILLIPIALEWVLLITTLAPVALVGRFNTRPRLGLAIWFGSLLSAGLATGLALVVAIWSYFDTFAALEASLFGVSVWFMALAVSFGPWLALLLGGVSLVLVQQRLEPLVQTARQIKPAVDHAKQPLLNFMGTPVFAIDLPFAYAVAGRREIIVSSALQNVLNTDAFAAVLWHELGHVRGRHFGLKKLARLVRVLSPTLAASKALVLEVERLCEVVADDFAVRNLGNKNAPALESARAIFKDSAF